ncbi:histidinol-phosphatase HisJ family protein [uncultured Eubacterium sp.]|uniref:histidinol-phosphatase HisJ family protein n=1 Tax=uncultured Eubacterium sp. TaxID=165185 RepID=UPI0026712632|nr:histidinol-phosphatase HisJ family protein [uncultured Eubacterium sp.]
MYSDYHVHSLFSFDSEEKIKSILERAINLGMKQIAITDHQDFNWPVKGEFPNINIDEYSETINVYKEKYKNRIDVLKGIELGLMKGTSALCQNLIHTSMFDFVIGSCHIVDNMDPYYTDFWNGRKDRTAFEQYFNTLFDGLNEFHEIDALGHMDYIVRYSPNRDSNYSVSDYTDIIDEILKFIIQRDIKLEINTSNLAKGFRVPNPHTDIIKRYKELGGMYVTVGSDAHKAEYIGYGFDNIRDIIDTYHLKIFTK